MYGIRCCTIFHIRYQSSPTHLNWNALKLWVFPARSRTWNLEINISRRNRLATGKWKKKKDWLTEPCNFYAMYIYCTHRKKHKIQSNQKGPLFENKWVSLILKFRCNYTTINIEYTPNTTKLTVQMKVRVLSHIQRVGQS